MVRRTAFFVLDLAVVVAVLIVAGFVTGLIERSF